MNLSRKAASGLLHPICGGLVAGEDEEDLQIILLADFLDFFQVDQGPGRDHAADRRSGSEK